MFLAADPGILPWTPRTLSGRKPEAAGTFSSSNTATYFYCFMLFILMSVHKNTRNIYLFIHLLIAFWFWFFAVHQQQYQKDEGKHGWHKDCEDANVVEDRSEAEHADAPACTSNASRIQLLQC